MSFDPSSLLSRQFGPPVPNSPNGQPWDDRVFQQATPVQRELVVDCSTLNENEPVEFSANGPNLTVVSISTENSADAFFIAFNEPKDFQALREGMSWIGQVFRRIFIKRIGNVNGINGSITLSYGTAFLFSPTFRQRLVKVTSSTINSGHFLMDEGLLLSANPNRIKTVINCNPEFASGNGNIDVVGFGNSQGDASNQALYALLKANTYSSLPYLDFPQATANFFGGIGSDVGTDTSEFGDHVAFWCSVTGPTQLDNSPNQTFKPKTRVEILGGGPIYLQCYDGIGGTYTPFANTPGYLLITEFFNSYE